MAHEHFIISTLNLPDNKIKDIQVFRHAFGFGGFCQHDDVAFHQPAGNHLRHGFAIFRTN